MIKQLSARPRADPGPAARAAGDGAADHPPPHAAVQRASSPRCAKRLAASSSRPSRTCSILAVVRHRRHGSGGHQLLRARRRGDRRQRRQVRRALGQDRRRRTASKPTRSRSSGAAPCGPTRSTQALDEHPDVARRASCRRARRRPPPCIRSSEIAAITRERDALLVVDGITAVGVFDMPMDRWGIDVLITGSQKALMLPPGPGASSRSASAPGQRVEQAKLPRFYFDLPRERDNLAKNTTAWTPAISLIIGLREALAMMQEEGCANVFARHERLARATRAGGDGARPAAARARRPESGGHRRLRARRRRRRQAVRLPARPMRVTFAGGQDQLKGKIVRIAHLGYMGAFDIDHRDRGARDGAAPLRPRGRARPRRRRRRGELLAALPA